MEPDSPIPQLTKVVSWPAQPPRKPAEPRAPVGWRRRDVVGGFAGLVTFAAVLAASWPILRRPRPGILDFLAFGTVGGAGGLLAVVVFAVAAGRAPLYPFGRAKPGWAREMTFLHAAYFAGAGAFAFAAAADTSGWMWPYGLFWVAMACWRVRAGWRPGSR